MFKEPSVSDLSCHSVLLVPSMPYIWLFPKTPVSAKRVASGVCFEVCFLLRIQESWTTKKRTTRHQVNEPLGVLSYSGAGTCREKSVHKCMLYHTPVFTPSFASSAWARYMSTLQSRWLATQQKSLKDCSETHWWWRAPRLQRSSNIQLQPEGGRMRILVGLNILVETIPGKTCGGPKAIILPASKLWVSVLSCVARGDLLNDVKSSSWEEWLSMHVNKILRGRWHSCLMTEVRWARTTLMSIVKALFASLSRRGVRLLQFALAEWPGGRYCFVTQ